LEDNGVTFESDTDTEVVAHLVSRELKAGRSPVKAVANVLPRLSGAFALVLLFGNELNMLVGARSGSPLSLSDTETVRCTSHLMR
jgi:glutamine---fructose-6-phosphate transaminase (isomerizing)